jgi:hypothetical protein
MVFFSGKMPPPRTRQIAQFWVQPSSNFADPPVVRRLQSKLRAPHRGTSLGPLVYEANGAIMTFGGDDESKKSF